MIGLVVAVFSLAWVPGWVWPVAAWVVCSVPFSLWVGRMLRDRDAHAPTMTVARHLAVVRDEEPS